MKKLRGYSWWRDEAKGWVSQYRPGIALLITSSVAGLATAPFGAFHFNQVSQLGLIANLMAVPLMGAVIMPAGVVAGVLALLGLQGMALWVMSFGIETVLGVAHWVAGLDGATRGVKAGPWYILPMIGLAGIWMILWRGRGIWLGPMLFVIALILWHTSSRPDLLMSDSGRLIGAMTPQGRALNRGSGNTFAANNWLTDDGDPSDRSIAVARWQPNQGQGWQRIALTNSWHLISVTSRSRWPADIPACDGNTILIATAWSGDVPLPQQTSECAQVWQRDALKQTGGLAYTLQPSGFTLQTVSEAEAQRPWVR